MIESANISLDELQIGNTVEVQYVVTPAIVDAFAELSGDRSPIHVNENAAKSAGFEGRVAHGAILVAWISEIVGMRLPGRRSILVELNVKFSKPIYCNDSVIIRAEVVEISQAVKHVELKIIAWVGGRKVAVAKVGTLVR